MRGKDPEPLPRHLESTSQWPPWYQVSACGPLLQQDPVEKLLIEVLCFSNVSPSLAQATMTVFSIFHCNPDVFAYIPQPLADWELSKDVFPLLLLFWVKPHNQATRLGILCPLDTNDALYSLTQQCLNTAVVVMASLKECPGKSSGFEVQSGALDAFVPSSAMTFGERPPPSCAFIPPVWNVSPAFLSGENYVGMITIN